MPNNLRMDPPPGGILDLTQRVIPEKPMLNRPNLEIVRVPVVPRPSPINLDTRNSSRDKFQPKSPFTPSGFPNVLDHKTITGNNLEITLVSPKKAPVTPQISVSPVPPIRSNPNSPQRSKQHMNGKYPSRSEPVSPYTPRKQSTPQQVIPNVPNLSHLNTSLSYSKNPYPQISIDKRKSTPESQYHHRRISEGEKSGLPPQMRQQHQDMMPPVSKQQKQSSLQSESSSRRHSMPGISPAFLPGLPQNNPAFLAAAQLSNNAGGKFLPHMFDPMYYMYNGLFPSPMLPTAAAPFLPPELSAYYKELLASTAAQARLGGHQSNAPTSKQ